MFTHSSENVIYGCDIDVHIFFRMSALYKTVAKMGQAPKLLKMTAPAVNKVQNRNLNLLEYQSKGLLQVENNCRNAYNITKIHFSLGQDFGVTVQKFRVASNESEAAAIPGEFPCAEYVIKAQVLAGGRGKGTFDSGFKGGVHLTKDPSKVAGLCTAMIGNK